MNKMRKKEEIILPIKRSCVYPLFGLIQTLGRLEIAEMKLRCPNMSTSYEVHVVELVSPDKKHKIIQVYVGSVDLHL